MSLRLEGNSRAQKGTVSGWRAAQTIVEFHEIVGSRSHTNTSTRRRGRLWRAADMPGLTGERRHLEFTAARRRSKV